MSQSPPIHSNSHRCNNSPHTSTCLLCVRVCMRVRMTRAIRERVFGKTPAFDKEHTLVRPSRRLPEMPLRRSSAQNHRRNGSTPHQSPATCRPAKACSCQRMLKKPTAYCTDEAFTRSSSRWRRGSSCTSSRRYPSNHRGPGSHSHRLCSSRRPPHNSSRPAQIQQSRNSLHPARLKMHSRRTSTHS